jgi:FKBP-type peptidyl-prolyl cis-trans isomerase FklB
MTKRTLSLIIGLLALVVGCATTQSTINKDPDLTTDMQKSSYAQGVNYMKMLQQNEIPIDRDLFLLGLNDVLNKTPLRLSPEQLLRGRDWVYVQQMLYTERTSQKNGAEGEAFLKANKNKAGVVTLASGVQYKILAEGKSKQKPTVKDTVVMRYRITRINGELFSSTENTPQVPEVAVNSIMEGWQEPLLLMTVGSKWELYVPGHLAYGEAGAPEGKLGPNETMIFNVELIGIKPPSSDKALMNGSNGNIKPSSRW